MKKVIIILAVCVGSASLFAQELVQTDYEKGFVKDGTKISVWQYFNSKKEPELVINHSTGKVMFLSKDTTDYFIYKNGQWVASKLDVHPIPIEGTQNFRNSILAKIEAAGLFANVAERAEIILNFEVDTLGRPNNFISYKSKDEKLCSELVKVLSTYDLDWIPAQLGNKKYSSRFEIDIVLGAVQNGIIERVNVKHKDSKKEIPQNELEDFSVPDAKYFGAIVLSPMVAYVYDESTYIVTEKKAEFPGGLKALAKFLASNLRYPPSARRMGLEGRVSIRFLVEKNGDLTDIGVLRGFDDDCDRSALETVKKMTKWKAAERRGRPVRSVVILPITFKLAG